MSFNIWQERNSRLTLESYFERMLDRDRPRLHYPWTVSIQKFLYSHSSGCWAMCLVKGVYTYILSTCCRKLLTVHSWEVPINFRGFNLISTLGKNIPWMVIYNEKEWQLIVSVWARDCVAWLPWFTTPADIFSGYRESWDISPEKLLGTVSMTGLDFGG